MYSQIVVIFCLVLLLCSCGRQGSEQVHVSSQTSGFPQDFPALIVEQPSPSFSWPKSLLGDSLKPSYTYFAGKYHIADKITLIGEDSLKLSRSDYEFGYMGKENKRETSGLMLMSDYNRNFKYGFKGFYPLFVLNVGDEEKMLVTKDKRIFAIQEARDSQGIWRPIEVKSSDFCGNGYLGIRLPPSTFALVLLRKYEGDFKTIIRIRFQNGKQFYLSPEFEGSIKYTQFYLPKQKSTITGEVYKDSWLRDSAYHFMGAVPLELGKSDN